MTTHSDRTDPSAGYGSLISGSADARSTSCSRYTRIQLPFCSGHASCQPLPSHEALLSRFRCFIIHRRAIDILITSRYPPDSLALQLGPDG